VIASQDPLFPSMCLASRSSFLVQLRLRASCLKHTPLSTRTVPSFKWQGNCKPISDTFVATLTHPPSRVGWDGSLALAPYAGPRFREMRKLFQQTIGPREITKWHTVVESCTTQMLINIVKDPAGLAQHVREYVLTGPGNVNNS